MKTLITTTMALGVVLMLGANQSVEANCGCAGYATPAPSYGYGYANTYSAWGNPYYSNYAHNYYGQGLFTQITNSLR